MLGVERSSVAVAPALRRSPAIDRVRGLAIACMVLDHVVLVLEGPAVLRLTVGRLAVPLFFILSGYLVRRVSSRHLRIGLAGGALPMVVPWVDGPNVLTWYAVGAVLLAVSPATWVRVLLVVLPLTVAANGWSLWPAGWGYSPLALFGLMAVGSLLERLPRWYLSTPWEWGRRLPALLEPVGRHPLGWYVGHVLVLEVLRVAVISRV